MAETTETREEREARWWRDWFAADYSWEGLAEKEIPGGGQFGEQTLQDYWRRDPATNKRRTDEALKVTGELFELESRWWHIAHLPPRGQVGWKSWKADLGASEWARLKALMAARLTVAVEAPGTFDVVGGGWRWKPEASDGRALLDGAVLGPGPIDPDGEVSPISVSCRRSAFLGTSDFASVTFGLSADFFGATFSGGASFISATFSGDARFDGATFSGDASFDRATFLGNARFDIATFSDYTSFDSATFSGYASFDSATSGHANFYSATFSGGARFDSATFSGVTSFDSAAFSGHASFDSATFSGGARFDSATFSGDARFSSATFSGDARFDSATFSGGARFDSATFSGDAGFYSATFSGYAAFYSATFSGAASFDSATFSGYASFDSATFSGYALFTGRFEGLGAFYNAVFDGPVTFSAAIAAPERDFPKAFYGARFAGIADFSGAVGEGQGARMAAAFAEAQFEKALILTDGLDGKQGQVFHKTLLANTWDTAEDQKARDAAFATLESGCRVVKIAMGKARDEVREQAYYRLQLRARQQRSDIGGWERAFGWLYGWTSDYGSSFSRPLVLLLAMTVAFGLLYWGLGVFGSAVTAWCPGLLALAFAGIGWSAAKEGADEAALTGFMIGQGAIVLLIAALLGGDPVWQGQKMALSAVFRPFATLAEQASKGAPAWPEAAKLGLHLITTIQSLLSGVLIFLFGLAVKRRFQIS